MLRPQTTPTEDTQLLIFKTSYTHIFSGRAIFNNETDDLVYNLPIDLVFKGGSNQTIQPQISLGTKKTPTTILSIT